MTLLITTKSTFDHQEYRNLFEPFVEEFSVQNERFNAQKEVYKFASQIRQAQSSEGAVFVCSPKAIVLNYQRSVSIQKLNVWRQ